MTLAEIEQTIAIFTAAGRRNIPVPISEWREYAMATRIGKVDQKALAKGKIKPVDTAPVNVKRGRKPKADRQEAGLRANRDKSKEKEIAEMLGADLQEWNGVSFVEVKIGDGVGTKRRAAAKARKAKA